MRVISNYAFHLVQLCRHDLKQCAVIVRLLPDLCPEDEKQRPNPDLFASVCLSDYLRVHMEKKGLRHTLKQPSNPTNYNQNTGDYLHRQKPRSPR